MHRLRESERAYGNAEKIKTIQKKKKEKVETEKRSSESANIGVQITG